MESTLALNKTATGSTESDSFQERDLLLENAERNFVERPYNCSESILATFAEADGQDPAEVVGFASAFGQGIAGQGLTCGAITGALMLFGKTGREKGLDRKQIRASGAAFFREFQEEFGHTECLPLSGHDCNDPGSSPFDIRSCGKFLRFAAGRVHDFRA